MVVTACPDVVLIVVVTVAYLCLHLDTLGIPRILLEGTVLFRHPPNRQIAKQPNTAQKHIRGTRYLIRRMDKTVSLKSLDALKMPLTQVSGWSGS